MKIAVTMIVALRMVLGTVLAPTPGVAAETLPEAASGEASRPHIVLVMADDQGWGDMGYQGHPVVQTPRLDAAARNGLRFDRFYAAAPVCSPTRGSVLTGRHPNRYGVFQWGYPLRPQETTIAEVLGHAGYATAHFGKWHLGSVRRASPVHPGQQGFDYWLSAPNFFDNDPVLSLMGRAVPLIGESSEVTAQAAIDWMRKAVNEPRPMLVVVWFGSPHAPHKGAFRDRSLYASQPEKLRDFYAEVTGIDRAFGQLQDALQELGIAQQTLLWYGSDNGALPGVGSAGEFRGKKGEVYDGGLLVPAVMQWPARIAAARTTSLRCNTCDIFPTLLDAAGIRADPARPLDGVSLLPVIDGRADMTQRPQPMGFWDYAAKGILTPSDQWMQELWEAQQAGHDLEPDEPSQQAAKLPSPPYPLDKFPGHAAWIDGDWKLHRIEDPAGLHWELYDLAHDPGEQTDLAKLQPLRTRFMREALEEWLRSVTNSLNGGDYAAD